MKTIFLFFFAIVMGYSVNAQQFSHKISGSVNKNVGLKIKFANDELTNQDGIYKPNYKYPGAASSAPGVTETIIGQTRYDNESNASVQNRIYAYPDGTIAATWIFGEADPAFADRGTGYNYFDGMNWGDEPTARTENARCGWPSYSPLGDGEITVSHNGSTGLLISKRPVRGTGSWTTTLLAGPSVGGATSLLWPRMITSGNTVHIIACTNTGSPYQGLSSALVYYRSTDGGATFSGPTILPGLDATTLGAVAGTSFKGFGGDNYAFAKPKGDTIAFVCGAAFRGMWVLKSFDNGATWTNTTVMTIPTFTDVTPIIPSSDGSMSMALDNDGKANIVFGYMPVSDADFTDDTYNYYPYNDGLIYWKEGMPVLDTNQLTSLDTLYAHGNLIATMLDYSGNDSIEFPTVGTNQFPFGLYGSSLSSMGQIVIDKNDNIYVSYSSCREDLVNSGAFPNAELYRHLYLITKDANSATWNDTRDLTDDVEHNFDECVYASMSYTTSDMLHIIYMQDPEPGTAVGSDADPYGDNYMVYLTFPTFVNTKPLDISKDVNVLPNPATDYANVQVMLSTSGKVEVNVYDVMGKMVLNNNYGQQPSGNHTYKVNTSTLTSGVYIFNIQAAGSQTSKKVIVK